MAGEIAVRAYITEPREDKLAAHRRPLSGAVLEQQRAAALEVLRRSAGDLAQAAERVRTRCQGETRLLSERWIRERRIIGGDVWRIAHDEIEPHPGERREPASLEEFDPRESELHGVAPRDLECFRGYIGGGHPPAWSLARDGERHSPGAGAEVRDPRLGRG